MRLRGVRDMVKYSAGIKYLVKKSASAAYSITCASTQNQEAYAASFPDEEIQEQQNHPQPPKKIIIKKAVPKIKIKKKESEFENPDESNNNNNNNNNVNIASPETKVKIIKIKVGEKKEIPFRAPDNGFQLNTAFIPIEEQKRVEQEVKQQQQHHIQNPLSEKALMLHKWYWPQLDAMKAATLLINQDEDCFLMRPSTKLNFVAVSIKVQNQVLHGHLSLKKRGLIALENDDSQYYESVMDFVQNAPQMQGLKPIERD